MGKGHGTKGASMALLFKWVRLGRIHTTCWREEGAEVLAENCRKQDGATWLNGRQRAVKLRSQSA